MIEVSLTDTDYAEGYEDVDLSDGGCVVTIDANEATTSKPNGGTLALRKGGSVVAVFPERSWYCSTEKLT